MKNKLLQLQTKRDYISNELSRVKEEYQHWNNRYENCLKARNVIQIVAKSIQQNVEEHISTIVTTALNSIPFSDNGYNFIVEFYSARGKTECNLWFERNGEKIEPLSTSAGGAIDICSLALRMAFWNLKQNRNVIILDEPFRNLSQNYHTLAYNILKKLSDELNLQIIMVSHNNDIIENSDNLIRL